MITSATNPRIRRIIQLNQRAKARREEGVFPAEGRKMFAEAPSGWIREVYVSESAADDPEISGRIREEGLPSTVVSDQIFRQMSDTQTPQGILTLLKTPSYRAEELLHDRERLLLLILEDLQDPGNMGTIFRTAEAAGVRGIFLTKNCVDVTNPKVIRSTMGSIYRMPYVYGRDVAEIARFMKEAGVAMFAAHLAGGRDYDAADYTGGTAFMIGNEGSGLSEAASEAADSLIRIPMHGRVESLNAAMAAGILMFEAARQRRNQ